jgi:hypothetical protein
MITYLNHNLPQNGDTLSSYDNFLGTKFLSVFLEQQQIRNNIKWILETVWNASRTSQDTEQWRIILHMALDHKT